MAQKVGANLIDMGYIQLLPTTDPYTGATNHAVSLTTGIYLNTDGKRFVNELGRRDELARAALAQPGHKFFILATSDANKIDKEGRNQYGIKVADLIKSKKVFEANTWDELAEKAGINKENMKKTIADWNAFCRNPVNDPSAVFPVTQACGLTARVRSMPLSSRLPCTTRWGRSD